MVRQKNGLVVVLDMLGMKGIWLKKPPRETIKNIQLIHQNLEKNVKKAKLTVKVKVGKPPLIKIYTFSDTIIMTFTSPGKIPQENGLPIVASMLGKTFLFALDCDLLVDLMFFVLHSLVLYE